MAATIPDASLFQRLARNFSLLAAPDLHRVVLASPVWENLPERLLREADDLNQRGVEGMARELVVHGRARMYSLLGLGISGGSSDG